MMITEDELEDGVKGQQFSCKRMEVGDRLSDRFMKCKLDGEPIGLPTDTVKFKDVEDNIRMQSSGIWVNLGTVFGGDTPRIEVEKGWTKEHSESPELDKFAVMKVKGLDKKKLNEEVL